MARPDERPSVAHEVERDVVTQLPDVEVFDVQLPGGVLRVTIDHPQGVDHEVCSRVSNVLRGYTERFQLEVSSPGIPRPLVRPKHFQRSVGQPDRRRDPRGDRRPQHVHRLLRDANDERIVLELPDREEPLPSRSPSSARAISLRSR